MKRFLSVGALLVLVLACVGQAKAGVVYTSGPTNGNINAWAINNGFSETDSFTVTSPTNISSFQVGLWVDGGATPTSLSWAIGTTPTASDVASGSGSLVNTLNNSGAFGYYDVYNSDGSALTPVLGPGTYWFTLSNGSASDGGPVYWDENDGPGTAYTFGNGYYYYSHGVNAFTLYNGAATPEPASLTLLGLGGLSLVGYGWRRRQSVTA